jgi:tetratricopeptide (TPR) repeat protein
MRPVDAHPAPPPPPPPPPVWPEPVIYPHRRWPIVLLVIGGIVSAAIGVEVGDAAGTVAATAAASALAADGSYASAIAVDEHIEERTGPLYLLDPGAAGTAAGAEEQTRLAWAAALGRKGKVDAAVALYRSVTAPALRAKALNALAALLYRTSTANAAEAQYSNAILRLLEIGRLAPGTPTAVQAAQQIPIDQADEAGLLITAGRAADAVAILNAVVAERSAQATRAADSLFPSALLAAGEEALAHDAYAEALGDLKTLVSNFPSSAEAPEAEAMMAAPLPVSGTLVTHSGSPVSGRVRLSSNYKAEPGGMYQTSAPFYNTTSDASGDFSFSGVPIGGPYVLEVFTNGNWTTLINPSTNQPANPVTVTALVPVDLTFVVLPS